jgi:hypothetical protein
LHCRFVCLKDTDSYAIITGFVENRIKQIEGTRPSPRHYPWARENDLVPGIPEYESGYPRAIFDNPRKLWMKGPSALKEETPIPAEGFAVHCKYGGQIFDLHWS